MFESSKCMLQKVLSLQQLLTQLWLPKCITTGLIFNFLSYTHPDFLVVKLPRKGDQGYDYISIKCVWRTVTILFGIHYFQDLCANMGVSDKRLNTYSRHSRQGDGVIPKWITWAAGGSLQRSHHTWTGPHLVQSCNTYRPGGEDGDYVDYDYTLTFQNGKIFGKLWPGAAEMSADNEES